MPSPGPLIPHAYFPPCTTCRQKRGSGCSITDTPPSHIPSQDPCGHSLDKRAPQADLGVASKAAVQQAVGGVRQEHRAQRQHQRWHARARQRNAPAAARMEAWILQGLFQGPGSTCSQRRQALRSASALALAPAPPTAKCDNTERNAHMSALILVRLGQSPWHRLWFDARPWSLAAACRHV